MSIYTQRRLRRAVQSVARRLDRAERRVTQTDGAELHVQRRAALRAALAEQRARSIIRLEEQLTAANSSPRVRKVLSGRLTPPKDGMIPLPVERVLLDSGKGYREELNVDHVNHATGAVYVSRRGKP
jgi:hypothetical protein